MFGCDYHMEWIIKLRNPIDLIDMAKESVFEIILDDDKWVYDAVEKFEEGAFKKIKTKGNIKSNEKIELRKIINLHNSDGIRDVNQIESMIKELKSGKEIFSKSGIPNIKLIKTKNDEFVLFDGHHSLLSYMYFGKKYLDEIPHLIIEKKADFFSDDEIKYFFIEHADKLKNKDWRNYAMNWQELKENQLCEKKEKNMGEVFNLIKKILRI